MVNELIHWVIILFVSLFGIGVLYTFVRIVIAFVSPETSNKIELYFILRDAKRHFSFLLGKGYKISHLKYTSHHLAGWYFQLESPDNELSIILDQQERPLLAFGKEKTDKRHQIFLEAMIYYLTEKKVFIGNSYNDTNPSRSQVFKKTAKLLNAYFIQIEDYLNSDFEKSKNELASFQKQYVDLLIQESEQRQKTWKH